MQRIAFAGIAVLAITLGGCQNQPEETPDITEAIPLDEQADEAGQDAADDGAGPAGDEANTGADSTPVPGEADTPPLPGSMEGGSNPPGMTEPPAGSKVQPAGG